MDDNEKLGGPEDEEFEPFVTRWMFRLTSKRNLHIHVAKLSVPCRGRVREKATLQGFNSERKRSTNDAISRQRSSLSTAAGFQRQLWSEDWHHYPKANNGD